MSTFLNSHSTADISPEQTDLEQPDHGKVLTGLHILSVDDDKDSLEITACTLELAGATVTSVPSGEEALQALAQLVPDALISDVGMPDLDGYMLIRQIRTLPADKGGQIKAIALTAYARETDRASALTAGFQYHLTKPVDPDVLVAIVKQLIDSDSEAGNLLTDKSCSDASA